MLKQLFRLFQTPRGTSQLEGSVSPSLTPMKLLLQGLGVAPSEMGRLFEPQRLLPTPNG